ncbi:MAG: hypothetical protein MI747_03610 [Desulfobacterales bacterium]|nr:hypothetical protein [Desulfobacterales bacterium]
MAISSIDGTNFITGAYSAGKGGNISELKSVIQGGGSPIANFAMVAAYFAGQEEKTMQTRLNEYEKQHDKYKECLDVSKIAHQKKGEAASKNNAPHAGSTFKNYMVKIMGGGKTGRDKFDGIDVNDDNKHNEDEMQSYIDVLNKQKDIESTELNALSTKVDMAVKDSSEAQQMAANAVKKATDLMSTQGRTSGG